MELEVRRRSRPPRRAAFFKPGRGPVAGSVLHDGEQFGSAAANAHGGLVEMFSPEALEIDVRADEAA